MDLLDEGHDALADSTSFLTLYLTPQNRRIHSMCRISLMSHVFDIVVRFRRQSNWYVDMVISSREIMRMHWIKHLPRSHECIYNLIQVIARTSQNVGIHFETCGKYPGLFVEYCQYHKTLVWICIML